MRINCLRQAELSGGHGEWRVFLCGLSDYVAQHEDKILGPEVCSFLPSLTSLLPSLSPFQVLRGLTGGADSSVPGAWLLQRDRLGAPAAVAASAPNGPPKPRPIADELRLPRAACSKICPFQTIFIIHGCNITASCNFT